MKIEINRCVKRPGLIDRARTYYLQYNETGLYIICLGNATQTPVTHGDFIATAIAEKAVNYFQNKYEVKILETEARLAKENINDMAKEKNCFFLKKENIEYFKFNIESDGSLKIQIKGNHVKMNLFTHPHYGRIAQSIQQIISAT